MKIKIKELKKLIETFVVDPKGNTRYLGLEDYGEYDNYSHPHADNVMMGANFNNPILKDKIENLYDSHETESKKQAIELASSLGAVSKEDRDSALFDVNIATDPAFDQIKSRAGRVDLSKLKQFCNNLHRNGELFSTDPKKPPSDVYDIIEKYNEMYPDDPEPDEQDLMDVGVDVYGGDLYVVGYKP